MSRCLIFAILNIGFKSNPKKQSEFYFIKTTSWQKVRLLFQWVQKERNSQLKHSEQETKENFSYFLENLSECLEECFPGSLETEEVTVLKNNSVTLHGLVIKEKGSSFAPTFYLAQEFEEYKSGHRTMEELAASIMRSFEEERQSKYEVINRLNFQWESMKDFITYRLINREKNEELLRTAPYEEFLDLALIYQYTVKLSGERQGTVQILNEHMERLQISQEELREAAWENTKRIYPPAIYAMQELLLGMKEPLQEGEIEKDNAHGMYVLTNASGIHGAASLIYKEWLRKFAEAAGGGFYVLPSSIHEVILLPKQPDICLRQLAAAVKEINATKVEATEVLSDQVYYFEPEGDCLKRLGAWTE